ncbi:hypothetical protein F383_33509 [Gossypium arboreum]|uniref:Uncharacterized protein n=1 Tax=Gossypium arboreum TaxID=29729 RepID=A0A0B0PQ04_GOSAR|nr:hypothetical protein F383_33509 [Gossypium arboreum]
MEERKISLVL